MTTDKDLTTTSKKDTFETIFESDFAKVMGKSIEDNKEEFEKIMGRSCVNENKEGTTNNVEILENEKEDKIFENILFHSSKKPSGEIVFKSSAYGRKIIILDKDDDKEPAANHLYDVKVVNETYKDNQKKGVYFVRIINKGLKISDEERKKIKQSEYICPIENNSDNSALFVLEAELPYANKRSAEVPSPENFKHFTLDQRTLETINKVATAVELKQPCLLEGETSTSKTSSIEYLAMRTKNEFIRFNLNGQTDTSEIIGKYVPNDGQLQISFKNALKNPELLSDQTREILTRANSEGRGLSLIESQKIAENENITIPEWRWQDGLLPDAMKNGKWIVFDEINLAEPQILERLNSVLEKNPSLTLSENGGFKIGSGGDCEVDDNFRIMATMNPAEYSGRKPMSPAYKDRWTSYMFVQSPTEKDYESMIRLMTYGEQPVVKINNSTFQENSTEPMFESLRRVNNFESFIPKLTKFQSILEKMSQNGEIGRDKKEPYIFTRRGLIDFMHYLEKKSIINRYSNTRITIQDDPKEIISRALEYFFLDKISNQEDRKKVTDQMDAIGISRNNFLHIFKD